MEELVPIVGKLAEKYTSHESTSITYEKAEQLMGAVLYCIHELWESSGNAPSLNKKLSAQRAYEMGAAYVREKTGKALDLYNRILPEFCHYENKCLYDTFVKGIPEFFKWYDVQFEPQNTILTLDYPLLKDISEYTGIDKIFEFIKAIGLEQKFLKLFPAGYVINILSKDNRNWQESMDNICEIVFKENKWLDCLFIDEVQFLTEEHIKQLWTLAHKYNIDVYCYGLKLDYKNELFPASKQLLILADTVEEIKSKCCHCVKKATTHLRYVNGKVVKSGESIHIDKINPSDEKYESVCQDCWNRIK